MAVRHFCYAEGLAAGRALWDALFFVAMRPERRYRAST
jgi:hypothetical protein